MAYTPAHLGFHEAGPLAVARNEVLEAIKGAGLAGYRAAWSRYQELAEAQINTLSDRRRWEAIRTISAKARVLGKAVKRAGFFRLRTAWRYYGETPKSWPKDSPFAKAQIGLILAKADIWRLSHNRVRYWEELYDAQTYATGMGYQDVTELTSATLNRVATSRSFFAEFLQATRRYDDAIAEYIEREQDECLTDRERGIVNLRLAECYQALLDVASPVALGELHALFGASIESALTYLEDEPEKTYALRLLEEFEGDT